MENLRMKTMSDSSMCMFCMCMENEMLMCTFNNIVI